MTPLERAWRGTRSDWRLHMLSVFSVAVAFVCLASALLVLVNVHSLQHRWSSSGRASVYLKKDVLRADVAAIEQALRGTEGVTGVRFVSSEDARRELLSSGSDPVLDALPVEAFPSSIEVSITSEGALLRLEKLRGQLEKHPAVERVETYAAWGDRLSRLLSGGVIAATLLAAIVLAAVVSVVTSTLRLALQRRRIEVEVLKLVGATDSYVRRPFVIEGASQGALGAGLGVGLLAILFLIVRHEFDASLSSLLGVSPAFLPIPVVLVLIIVGAGIGALSAFVSLRKFLVV